MTYKWVRDGLYDVMRISDYLKVRIPYMDDKIREILIDPDDYEKIKNNRIRIRHDRPVIIINGKQMGLCSYLLKNRKPDYFNGMLDIRKRNTINEKERLSFLNIGTVYREPMEINPNDKTINYNGTVYPVNKWILGKIIGIVIFERIRGVFELKLVNNTNVIFHKSYDLKRLDMTDGNLKKKFGKLKRKAIKKAIKFGLPIRNQIRIIDSDKPYIEVKTNYDKFICLFDLEDMETVLEHTITVKGRDSCLTCLIKVDIELIKFSKFILNSGRKKVRHKNGNRLDNRRENLIFRN